MASRLQIEHLRGVYTAPPATIHPGGLRRKLDGLVERQTERVGRLLEQQLDSSDESVWLIRKLRVELSADLANLNEARLGGAWADAVAAGVWRTVVAGQGEEVVRFDSPEELDAAFLVDLAAGRAWSAWRYESFGSLRSLTVGQAARRVFERKPQRSLRILAALGRNGGLERSLRMLSPRQGLDVWRIIRRETGAASARELKFSFEFASKIALSNEVAGDQAKHQLRLLAAALERAAGSPSTALSEAVELVVIWRRALAASADPAQLSKAVAAGGVGQAVALLREANAPEAIEIIPRLVELQLNEATLASRPDPAVAEEHAFGIASDYCGAFLLLPAMFDCGVADAFAAAGDADTASALRRLTLAKCFGRKRAAAAVADSAIVQAAGCDSTLEAAALDAEAADALAAAVVQGLVERGRAGGLGLLVETTSAGAPEQVISDVENRAWLWLGDADIPRAASLAEVARRTGAAAESNQDGSSGSDAELRYLSLIGLPGFEWLGPELDRALSLASHAVLRRFANGLPGFAGSSAEFLAKNFFYGPGGFRRTEESWLIELPSVPLSVVLRMTGAAGRRFQADWLDPQLVELSLSEG